jgi:predicted metal-dependent hydrolase
MDARGKQTLKLLLRLISDAGNLRISSDSGVEKPMTVFIDQIIRSRRKTIALEISADAKLIVRAPLFTSEKTINRLILRKKQWIKKKQEQARKRRKNIFPIKFHEGDSFPFLGNGYPLHIIAWTDSPLEFDGKQFLLKESSARAAQKLFINWYRDQAIRIFMERISWYASISAVKPDSVKISNARKRWGSCSARGEIRLNWRLVMAPIEIIDYVVVHELIHIRERNHSKKFWNNVNKILPEYKKQRIWLRENGHLLTLIDG